MFFFEVLKSIFEGISLGATMLLLLKIFQNIFEGRNITQEDIYFVFAIALLSVVGKYYLVIWLIEINTSQLTIWEQKIGYI